jgi:hypothetical protein
MGVTDTQSSKWQKLAALPEDKFEIRVEHAKARVPLRVSRRPSWQGRAPPRSLPPTAYAMKAPDPD